MDDFESLDPEMLQQLMELGVIPDEMESLKGQIETAQALRNSKGPQGTDTGRVYVAASPLEHIAHAWQGIRAQKDMDKYRAQQQELLAKQIRGRAAFFNKMRSPTSQVPPLEDYEMVH